MTTFEYDDAITSSGTSLLQYQNGSGDAVDLAPNFTDPTSQTNAEGGTKTFTYDGSYRVMDSVIDEDNRLTEYEINNLGLRVRETIYEAPENGGAKTKETIFEYADPDFPGFMTKKVVKALVSLEILVGFPI